MPNHPHLPPRTKPCTICGEVGGPFRRDGAYWDCRCIPCRKRELAANRWRYAAQRTAYLRRWKRAQRLKHARAALKTTPTRALINFLGRQATPPSHKWCSYGQHQVIRVGGFHRRTSSRDGLATVCKKCRSMQDRLRNVARKKRKNDARLYPTPCPVLDV